MKVAELTDREAVRTTERSQPEPAAGEVLVRIDACGVCMTDYHMYSGTFAIDYPLVAGHESAGEVAAVGDDVSRFESGDRVAINPTIPCNECAYCKSGRNNLCRSLTSVGGAADHILDGAFAEYVVVPATHVESIGDLSMTAAAFAEPLACCIHGVDQVDLTSGDTAVVIGAGPIGLLLVQTLRASGAGTIVVSELVEHRRELALEVGADYVVDPEDEDPTEAIPDLVGDVDVALEAVGLPHTIEQAMDLTDAGGTTLVFGVPPEDATIEVSPFEIFYEELELVGTFSLLPNDFRRAITFLQNGRIDVDPLVTDEYGLDGLQTAFDQMENQEGLKKIIHPQQ